MVSPLFSTAARIPRTNDSVTESLLEAVRGKCGLAFSSNRLRVLEQAVQERCNELDLYSIQDYWLYLSAPRNGGEWQNLIELLMNRDSRFFRYPPAFRVLQTNLLPQLYQERMGGPIHLWSAGCAYGQEAYSLAMTVCDTPELQHSPVMIWATDISQQSLERTRAGQYRESEVRGLTDRQITRYFTEQTNKGERWFTANSELKELILVQRLNLVSEWPNAIPQMDVIFCHNVLIYFSAMDRQALVERLCESLTPGGYLCVGPGEVLDFRMPGVEAVSIDEVRLFRRTG